MALFFSYFAFLLVHSFTLSVVASLPVFCDRIAPSIQCLHNSLGEALKARIVSRVTSVLTHVHGTNSKQTKMPSELFPLRTEDSAPRHATPFFKNVREEKFERDKEREEEFQPCRVSNKTYQHRERIPRADPCEICVCADSDIYCFWKLCPFFNSTTSAPAPSTASENNHGTTVQSIDDNNVTLKSTNETEMKANKAETTDEKFSKILKDERKYNALKKLEAMSPENSVSKVVKYQDSGTSTEVTTVCYVMGVKYKYGEVLPRDTGTCLECACSEGGRVSCSPKDCVSQPDLDYLSHNNNLDMFDLDTF